MQLTIGMAAFQNKFEVWATVQALRLFHDLTATEILVVDNAGDDGLERWMAGQSGIRYVRDTAVQGSMYPKDAIFRHAQGEWVLVIDPHVFLWPGSVQRFRAWCMAHPDCQDLLHGPLVYDDLVTTAKGMTPEWGSHMWGKWDHAIVHPEGDVQEIQMHGMGLFACRKDAWLGFPAGCTGFGAEEGVIHEKFRKAGRKVLLLPWLRWVHYFKNSNGAQDPVPYRLTLEDRIRNYYLGFQEVGLDIQPLIDQFGVAAIERVAASQGDTHD